MAEDFEEAMIAEIRINNKLIIERKAGHWEPKDLKDKIEQVLGKNYTIEDIEMTGVSGSSIVIDELIDCLGTLL